jgi:ferritin-like protein
MQERIGLGTNRTGVKASPIDAEELVAGLSLQDDEPAPEFGAADIRATYAEEAEPVGSMPPPTDLKGTVGAVVDSFGGKRLHILLDKLGERAAYERSGTRLYDAMLLKAGMIGALPEGMTLAALQEIRDEEASHFALLGEAIEALGGDATVQTPCADVSGVQGMGLFQVMNDPRTTLSQALQTLLAAELIDVASWELLITLSDQLGHEEWSNRFALALEAENRHLMNVRRWLEASLQTDAALLP